MENLLRRMAASSDAAALDNLLALIDSVRPPRATDHTTAVNNLRALSFLLAQHADLRHGLRRQLAALMRHTRQVELYTDTGILSNEPLPTALWRRVGERLLPLTPQLDRLKDVLGLLFHRHDDHLWLAAVPFEVWHDLTRSLRLTFRNGLEPYSRLQILESIQVLSCRIATIGLEPELVQNAPDTQRFESPFLRQNIETLRFAENYRQALTERQQLDDDHRHIMVLLDQCSAHITRIRKHALRHGVSVSLTYHLLRLEQHFERMQNLLKLIDPIPDPAQGMALLQLVLQLVRAENRKHSLRDVLHKNTELLALQVTEHASHTGEHYIADTRSEWLAMFRAAAGAGLVIGCMALIKMLIGYAHLPPLIEALAFGLNYGLGFVVIHLLHCTIATKQPAMTAATIAATLPQPGQKAADAYQALADLIVKVLRTQFVAIFGNVLLTMPTALGLGLLWAWLYQTPLVNAEKIGHLLHDLQPIAGLGLAHAAIAGVWLFVAGLISGYYDNKALYHHIPERVAAHPVLQRLMGRSLAGRLAHYLEHNLGALAGNFYFGMMLGMTGFIGFLLGLPLDIRHITFSSAYLAFATAGLDFQIDPWVFLLGLWGVMVIGGTNLLVSFMLALWTALRSRQRRLSELRPLLGLLLRHFMKRPQDFVFAPKPTHKQGEHDGHEP
jgi:site-specific recombinase